MLQAHREDHPPPEIGSAGSVTAAWAIVAILLSVGGLFVSFHHRVVEDTPRLHLTQSVAQSSVGVDDVVQ